MLRFGIRWFGRLHRTRGVSWYARIDWSFLRLWSSQKHPRSYPPCHAHAYSRPYARTRNRIRCFCTQKSCRICCCKCCSGGCFDWKLDSYLFSSTHTHTHTHTHMYKHTCPKHTQTQTHNHDHVCVSRLDHTFSEKGTPPIIDWGARCISFVDWSRLSSIGTLSTEAPSRGMHHHLQLAQQLSNHKVVAGRMLGACRMSVARQIPNTPTTQNGKRQKRYKFVACACWCLI